MDSKVLFEQILQSYDRKIVVAFFALETNRIVARSNELYSCLTTGGIQYSYNNFFEANAKLLETQKKGEHKGIKAITIIDESNMKLAKILLDAGIQIRHIRNLPPISFTLSDKEISMTIEKMEAGKLAQSVLLSKYQSFSFYI